jgi:phosphotransferase system  glucose/maltose/N-acetylglucosamine-specific IIC component
MRNLKNTVSRGLATGRRLRPSLVAAGLLATTAGAMAQGEGSAETLVTAITSKLGDIAGYMWTIGGAVAAILAVVVVITLVLRNGKKVATSS